MSSSSAKILRRPARKIACVSARITRMNWPLPSFSWVCSMFSSTLTGVLSCMLPLAASATLEPVLVDDHAHAPAATFFKTPHHPAPAVELHIGRRSHNVRGQRDRKIHHRTYRHLRIHYLEQHSIGGNVRGLGVPCARFRFHRNWQLDRKTHRTLHVDVTSARLLGRRSPYGSRLRRRCRLILFSPGQARFSVFRCMVRHHAQITPGNQQGKVTEVIELRGFNALGIRRLQAFCGTDNTTVWHLAFGT